MKLTCLMGYLGACQGHPEESLYLLAIVSRTIFGFFATARNGKGSRLGRWVRDQR